MRFTYPEGKDAYVVLDLNKSHNKIKIIPEQRKVVGYTTHASQAVPQGYANYFVIVFDQPIEGYGTWTTDEGKIRPGVAEEEGFFVSGYLKFAPGGQVNARVVSSFISEEQAEENFRQELAGVKDLEEVKAKAAAAWNKQLGKVEVEGGSEEDKATFYPVCIITMLFPRQFYEYNQAGEPVYYSPYDGKVHKGYMFTDNGFWDTFRAQFPLNLLLHPEMHGRYLKSLLDAYDQSGWLPSWSCPGHSGGMIGNHAFSLLADAWVKGVRTFDPQQALKAMYHDLLTRPLSDSRSGGRDGEIITSKDMSLSVPPASRQPKPWSMPITIFVRCVWLRKWGTRLTNAFSVKRYSTTGMFTILNPGLCGDACRMENGLRKISIRPLGADLLSKEMPGNITGR